MHDQCFLPVARSILETLLANFNMDNGAANKTPKHEGFDSQLNPGESNVEQLNAENTSPQDSRSALAARLRTSKNVELYVYEAETNETIEALTDVSSLDLEVGEPQDDISKQQITFKSEQGRLLLLLPTAAEKSFTPVEWEELCQQLKRRLIAEDRFFQTDTIVHLIVRDRLLDNRQLQEVDELLQMAQLRLKRIYTQRRQTAVAAATAGYSVEQQTKLEHLNNDDRAQGQALETPMYLQMTVRSGVEIRHPGTIVVLGDVNPGGALIAAGDIFVWGRLRGVAHAGSEGNTACRIMALHMQPTQLRIADHVARAPEKPPALYQPEVAYVNKDSIRIAIASEFAQIHLNSP